VAVALVLGLETGIYAIAGHHRSSDEKMFRAVGPEGDVENVLELCDTL
jgi:hypothetical protein